MTVWSLRISSGKPSRDDPPLGQHDDACAQRHDEFHVVLDHHEGRAVNAVVGDEPFLEAGEHAQVHAASRFIEQHQARPGHEGHRRIEKLLLAVGKRAGHLVAQMREAEELDQFVGFRTQPGIRRTQQAAEHAALMFLAGDDDVVEHRHLRKDRKLLERAADTELVQVARAPARNRPPLHLDPAGGGRKLAEDAVEQRRLAGAVRAR